MSTTTDLTPPRYHYDPSLVAAATFAGLFGVSGFIHLYQLAKGRTWYFIPFVIGVFFEVFGYIARSINAHQTPDWQKGPFIAQTLLLLLAPALFAASIYMILGRIIRILEAEKLSIVRVNWLTKIFVLGDVLSFVVQTIGGVILSNSDSKNGIDEGQDIVLGGLAIQIAFFGVFISVISVFHYRIVRNPTSASIQTTLSWKRYIFVLYGASLLIMVRSIFRVAQFSAGPHSVLQTKEVYLYCLDSALMLMCALLFNIQHPSAVVQRSHYKPSAAHVEVSSV
ncbi:RTA1 like protein-domain-containing protein [Ilyonectria robusta]|uniref:RTA1 like protein-domain-containing protein n=1 Tax=Ilyonectria robusta TaxID=1079257 RepID=UPI001E8D64EF|nr:RTA1 like protein-domain-containing protein [Ilyonectria robusta]KAH8667792.1 RTA1 like protein-domain-containing protein [Ilyonectria robusta]